MRTLASGRGIGKNVIGPYCMGELYIMIGPVIAENQLMFSHRVMADKCILTCTMAYTVMSQTGKQHVE